MGDQLEKPLPLTASANEVFTWKLLWIFAFIFVSFTNHHATQVFKHAKRLGYGEHDVSAVYIRFEHLTLTSLFLKYNILYIYIPIFSGQDSERECWGERRYRLPELYVQGAKIVAVYLCLKKLTTALKKGFWTNKHFVLWSSVHLPVLGLFFNALFEINMFWWGRKKTSFDFRILLSVQWWLGEFCALL